MDAHFLKFWDDLRSSYWFVPALMSVGAIILSFATTTVDGRLGTEWIEEVGWLYGNKPDGARALLSTVAGSMIGVAGVTFSITIASVVYASGQYGPRLLTNFMRDTGNQITLGTFIATFLYCLLVLRTVRSADEVPAGDTPAADIIGAFVPHIAILTAIVLALASVAVLIFFIHHIPESIHVSNVIAHVGHELNRKVDTLFPERLGHAPPDETEDERQALPDAFYDEVEPIEATRTGYVQGIDTDRLLALATEHDLVLQLRYRPGDFLAAGEGLLLAWPHGRVTDDLCSELRSQFTYGRHRTALQDIRFLINELVEIAARALSPGVNDPFTAIGCFDWLGSMLKSVSGRVLPAASRYDDDGALRIIADPTTYEDFTEAVFGQVVPYAATDRNAALHLLRVIGEVGGALEIESRSVHLRRAADRLLAACETSIPHEADLALLRERHRVVVRLISGPSSYEATTSKYDWIGGSA